MTHLAPEATASFTSGFAHEVPYGSSAGRESREREGLLASAIARAKQGDTSALHILYVRYADDVHRFVYSIVRDYHEAEDITQSLFVKLMRIIDKYEQREVSFKAWILRVARNAALDHVRARRQIPVERVLMRDEGHEQLGFERSQCIRTALERLPADQRDVLILRHIAGLTPSEIAEILGKTESSVYGLHHRGRGALKVALRELEAAPMTVSGDD
jgi:RNA polymerase sigma-70 factor (ECF subfamily)